MPLGGEFGLNSGAHGGVWECPDLFQIDVGRWTMEQGKTKNKIQHPKSNVQSPIKKWILISNIGSGTPNGGSGTQYFVGDFDGKKFINDNVPEKTLWLDSGKDDYAGITWSNAPDGRRIFIGWMSDWQYANKVPTVTWRSATTVPRELSLQTTKEGLRLFQKPVEELKVLRLPDVGRWTLDAGKTITTENYELNSVNGSATELDLSFDLSKTKSENFGIILSNSKNENIEIGYNVSDKQFYIDRSNAGKIDFSKEFAGKHIAPRISTHSILKMHLLIDVASVELFADDGNVVMTDIFFPNENFTTTKIFSRKGTTQLLKGRAWRLKSIWK